MTLVLNIDKMSVGLEQVKPTVLIIGNNKTQQNNIQKNKNKKYIIPTSMGNGGVTVNGKTLLKNAYT